MSTHVPGFQTFFQVLWIILLWPNWPPSCYGRQGYVVIMTRTLKHLNSLCPPLFTTTSIRVKSLVSCQNVMSVHRYSYPNSDPKIGKNCYCENQMIMGTKATVLLPSLIPIFRLTLMLLVANIANT